MIEIIAFLISAWLIYMAVLACLMLFAQFLQSNCMRRIEKCVSVIRHPMRHWHDSKRGATL